MNLELAAEANVYLVSWMMKRPMSSMLTNAKGEVSGASISVFMVPMNDSSTVSYKTKP